EFAFIVDAGRTMLSFKPSGPHRDLPSFPTRRSSDLTWIASDNRQGAYEAVTHLLRLGHRKIAFLQGVPNGRIIRDRYEGYKQALDRKSTRLNSSHVKISYAVFCLKKKNK